MRTSYCGQLNLSNIGQCVTLCGWVDRYRNLGNLIFIDMRDREGIVQVFFHSNRKNVFNIARELRNEFCLQLTGIVQERPNNQINNNNVTGEIEILAISLNIISRSAPLPIDIHQNNTEEQRLKYRYLDLRRPMMTNNLKIRSLVTNYIHNFMNKENFLNIETPILTKATPEGARDYIIPSRIHKGKFYALPQSSQLLKQILMISGFDRYYQIAKCFRDEDLRADRQPEFTQIDIETSFMSAMQVREIIERLICDLWRKIKGVNLNTFQQITYADSIKRFGSDKPDLRNPIELIDLTDIFEQTNFKKTSIFLEKRICTTIALRVPKGIRLNDKQLDEYSKYVKSYTNAELIWIKVIIRRNDFKINDIYTPMLKLFNLHLLKSILIKTNACDNDILFFCSDYNTKNVINALGALRLKLGNDLQLINKDSYAPLWIIDFPMFKLNEEGVISSVHHPFTAPKKDINEEMLINNPLKIIADAYDIIINGHEIGSGSVRINCGKIQQIIFDILKINQFDQKEKFGFLLNALKYGAPPHAGIALGLDRLIMILTGTSNIRDVIAFPKTTKAVDLMTKTPNISSIDILEELAISFVNENDT